MLSLVAIKNLHQVLHFLLRSCLLTSRCLKMTGSGGGYEKKMLWVNPKSVPQPQLLWERRQINGFAEMVSLHSGQLQKMLLLVLCHTLMTVTSIGNAESTKDHWQRNFFFFFFYDIKPLLSMEIHTLKRIKILIRMLQNK